MRLQRSTIIIFFIALSMAGGVYYYEAKVIPEREAEENRKQQLFAFTEDRVESLTVKNKQQTLKFKRAPESAKPKPGETIWLMEIIEYVPPRQNSEDIGELTPRSGNIGELAPNEASENAGELAPNEELGNIGELAPNEESGNIGDTAPSEDSGNIGELNPREELGNIEELTPSEELGNSEESENPVDSESGETIEENVVGTEMPANDAYVSFLLSELVNAKSDRSFAATEEQLKDYGFEKPMATVEVTLKNGQNHKLMLGKRDFTDKSLYARVDPSEAETEQARVVLVSLNFDYGVNRSLGEWKQPEQAAGEASEDTADKPDEENSADTSSESSEQPTEEDSAENSGETGGENSADTSGENSAETGGENSGENSTADSENNDGESPEQPAAFPDAE